MPNNIYQRINNVMKAISYIQKDTDVMGRYKAVSHDKVASSIRPHLISEGIVITASQVPIDNAFHTVETKNNPLTLYRAMYIINFVNIENPEDKVTLNIESHSQCTDDKSPGQTLSYAVKMAILKIFCLETGINDESKPQQKSDSKPVATQAATTTLYKFDGKWPWGKFEMGQDIKDISIRSITWAINKQSENPKYADLIDACKKEIKRRDESDHNMEDEVPF